MKKAIFLLITVLLFSCEKDLVETDLLGTNAGIIGTWVERSLDGAFISDDGIAWLERAEELNPDTYGFTLHSDGSFTERKNAGWCATPPISYVNFDGSWEPLSDSLIDITVAYWGGIMTYQMQIEHMEEDQLGIRYLYEENRLEVK